MSVGLIRRQLPELATPKALGLDDAQKEALHEKITDANVQAIERVRAAVIREASVEAS